jgi:hypothetical protein
MGTSLSDLTQIGKMRDAYPPVICRVEHIHKLFENDAMAVYAPGELVHGSKHKLDKNENKQKQKTKQKHE